MKIQICRKVNKESVVSVITVSGNFGITVSLDFIQFGQVNDAPRATWNSIGSQNQETVALCAEAMRLADREMTTMRQEMAGRANPFADGTWAYEHSPEPCIVETDVIAMKVPPFRDIYFYDKHQGDLYRDAWRDGFNNPDADMQADIDTANDPKAFVVRRIIAACRIMGATYRQRYAKFLAEFKVPTVTA